MRWPWSAAPSPRLEDAQADVLLQDLLSRDGTRITDAARTVARLFTASSLDALAAHADLIEQRCQGIALGGMLISNQAHLKAALRRLHYWHAREGCLCALNPGYPFFDPRRLVEQGQMQLRSVEEAEGGWGDCHIVTCEQCGQHWRAIDREYHYPWWEWIAV
ncbi:hypothetical protein [Stenotrophomonas maltophilia]|uniref:hypothetical protein n=1 Tax=Stenotrophomonas maltophilia TaxID=40324 RepID=UPI0015DBE2DA|nr:hypothetical protein [Stenotrophomonas maltophilia]QDL26837.1 hypothetical protein EGM71_03315 [Stenotrophomonas maltophilia]